MNNAGYVIGSGNKNITPILKKIAQETILQ